MSSKALIAAAEIVIVDPAPRAIASVLLLSMAAVRTSAGPELSEPYL